MTWKRANETGMDGRRHGGGGFQNRACRNCTPPCQGGEKLHPKRLDYACSHSYCLCLGFEPISGSSLTGVLAVGVGNAVHLHGRRGERQSKRFLT